MAAALLGHALLEHAVHLLEHGDLARLRLLELRPPPLQLPFDVALAPAQVAEAHGVDVDRVDLGQHVDERLARDPALRLVEDGRGDLGRAQDVSLDEVHDVERRAVHRLVGAQAEGRRHGHRRGPEGGDDLVLPAHVVGGGQDVVQGRAAQDAGPAGGVGDLEGEVGVAAGDERELEGRDHAVDVVLEPAGHAARPGCPRQLWS